MMKKQMILTALFFSAALGLFAQQGILKEISGTVELKPAGASAFVIAKKGDTIAPNTIVSTGFKSTAVITVGSTTLTVRPVTRLSLAEISQSQGMESLNVNLQTGRVRAEVKPPVGTRADMTVRSPSATASVRGTEFEFDTTTLRVIEGTVAYSGNSGTVMLVSAGGTSQIDPVSRQAADPIETSAAALLPPPPAGASEQSTRPGSLNTVEFTIELSFD
jgi:hypothetical protein